MNKDIFTDIADAAFSPESLTRWLDTEMWQLFEVYNAPNSDIAPMRRDIDHLVQLHRSTLTALDYSHPHIRAFLLILLGLCERLGIFGAIPHLLSIVRDNGIDMSSRMQAGISLIYPRPTTNDSLLGLFDSISPLLQQAIDTEEDNSRASLITFLNYCVAVARDTNPYYTLRLKDKITDTRASGLYPFIDEMAGIEDLDWDNPDNLLPELQSLIDTISDKSLDIIRASASLGNLIEEDTDYATTLRETATDFDKIRTISLDRDDNRDHTGRGVKIIDSEQGLYSYMKRFGNMHHAKIHSALQPPFPSEFPSRINLVDWGCGQGIASMVFLEMFPPDTVAQLLLIEPSEVALSRAALHCLHNLPDLAIGTVCKQLDQLESRDFAMLSQQVTVHLFSNILDIDDYSPRRLTALIESSFHGLNYLVCVSPDVSDINTAKFRSFSRHFKQSNPSFTLISHADDTKRSRHWCCNNFYRHPARARHGAFPNCDAYSPTNGCRHKWTRIMDVFSITL